MITRDGRILQVEETRLCQQCRTVVKHTSFTVRYNASPSDPNALLKTFRWVCSRCDTEKEETREVLVPSSRARLIDRMLRMREDYGIRSMSLLADKKKLTIHIAFEESEEQST